MKTYKYKFTKTTFIFIILGICVSVAAFAANTYYVFAQGVKTAPDPVYPVIRYAVMYFVSVLMFVLLTSILLSSYYSIDGKFFKTSFGIIKSKYKIEDIQSILLDKQTNKLSVYFSDEKYAVIVVKPEWYEDFIDELLKANPKIEFSINSKQAEPPEEKK